MVLDAPTHFGAKCLGGKCHRTQEMPLTSVAVLQNSCDDCNPVFSVRVFKKSNEKIQGNDPELKQENENLFDTDNPVWSEDPIKLHFNEIH